MQKKRSCLYQAVKVVAAAMLLLLIGVGVAPGVAEAKFSLAQGPANSFLGPETIQDIVKKSGPAVVKIETEMKVQPAYNPFLEDPFFRQFFGEQLQRQPEVAQALGSGFIISRDGYIVTNNHVVANATKIHVYLTERKAPYQAELVGSDAQLDLAVLKISGEGELPFLSFGESNKLEVGSWVVAIGNPYGLDHTVTVGVISAKGRPLSIGESRFTDLLQTDASINPGNSGGPLLDLQGNVIGINTAINAQAQGIGFAIPSSTVTQVLDQLMSKGKVARPWLGVSMQPVTKQLAAYFGLTKEEGILINSVMAGSPAQKAGLKRGDVLLEYNKKKFNDPEELRAEIAKSQVGEDAMLLIFREGKPLFIPVKLEAR